MKHLAVTSLIVIVCFAFASRVYAQCDDYATCAGQRADAQAKLGQWAQETAQAKAEERRAVATDRAYNRMIALTATEMARPTKTPVPTVTVQPSATSLPTATNTPVPVATVTSAPSATPNLGATVVGIAVQVLQRPQATPRPVVITADEMAQRQTIGAVLIVAIIVVLAAGVWFLIRVLTAKHTIEI